MRFLIRDRGSYLSESFDTVFQAIGVGGIPTLPQVPRMNAIAERWIRTCRREATGRIVITGQKHLRHPQGTRTLSTWGQRSPSGLISADPQYRSILEGFAESVSSADFQAGELVLSGDECR